MVPRLVLNVSRCFSRTPLHGLVSVDRVPAYVPWTVSRREARLIIPSFASAMWLAVLLHVLISYMQDFSSHPELSTDTSWPF